MRSRSMSLLMIAALTLGLALSGSAHAQVTGTGLHSAGPVVDGPLDLFPKWFMDKTGVAVEGCLEGPPLCLSSLADLSNPAIGEAFYWSAIADMTQGAVIASIEFALEMAFLTPVIDQANAMVFNRMRVRVTGLPSAGPFTLDHPYGQAIFTATPEPQLTTFEINDTVDLPGSSGPASFTGVLSAPNIGPFLRAVGAPAGRLGNPGVPSLVTGGPNGNSVTLSGGGITMTTNLFQVEGKIATNGGLSGVRANYSRAVTGIGTLNLFASSIGNQRILARIGGGANLSVVRLVRTAQLGNYRASVAFGPGQPFQRVSIRNATDASIPSVTLTSVPDIVSISRATFQAGTLTVVAGTSDQLAPGPTLQLFDNAGTLLKTQRGRLVHTLATPVNPGSVRVTSSAGGTATRVVTVLP